MKSRLAGGSAVRTKLLSAADGQAIPSQRRIISGLAAASSLLALSRREVSLPLNHRASFE